MSQPLARLAAALAACGPVWVQAQAIAPGLQVFGVVDVAAELASRVNRGDGSAGRQVRLGLGAVPSRWGVRGVEDLGGGLKALFALEAGFSADTGVPGQGGRVWGRQAFAGLEGGWGQLTAGRLYTLRYHAMFDGDFFGAGSQGLGTLDAGIPNARADNAVAWRVNGGPWSGGLNFSVGRDTVSANNPAATGCPGEAAVARQCREVSAMARYEGGAWAVSAAWERLHGGTASSFGGLSHPGLTDTRAVINGHVRTAASTRVGGGLLVRHNQGSATMPRSRLWWVAAEHKLAAPVVLTGLLARIDYAGSPNAATVLALRANYLFSRRITVYVSEQLVSNRGSLAVAASANAPGTGPLPGGAQNALQLGVGHSF